MATSLHSEDLSSLSDTVQSTSALPWSVTVVSQISLFADATVVTPMAAADRWYVLSGENARVPVGLWESKAAPRSSRE